jgi:site-specific DNA recombinase
MKSGSAKTVRCAIYTRVSTDQGLEQDFNSLNAQYEASQAYIKSQAHAGWTLLRAKYDDGGFSGGNTDRPAYNGSWTTSAPIRSMSLWSTKSIV